ncbi:M23 family metallopeptidase [Paenibacillus methanolicus]|uniref:Murein DD-endopeptidase MepM/ murein hydrolase activator NlpD n=1 Tax=Paenibacillus methanolicus TaxID=582686 RepID=A0A5S5CAH1_9BACL|nr:M23 family metallopeptidase [Paenibacillus methanolicus]TYP75366.1 murein DD-endopeptidase MepM/ murein hydrolase activator NlpD [Paenibacillus methanolicus]
MSVFNEPDRIRKGWNSLRQSFRRARSHTSSSIEHEEGTNKGKRILHRKPFMLAGGALAFLLIAGFSGAEYMKANTVDYYDVYRNGSLVGSVATREQVEALVAEQKKAIAAANPDVTMELDTGTITYKAQSAYKAAPDTDGTLDKLADLFDSHAMGVELKVDGKVIAVVKDQATADKILASVKNRYAPQAPQAKTAVTALAYTGTSKTASATPSTVVKSVKIVESVSTAAASVDPSAIADAGEVYTKMIKGSVKPTKYTVQAGDCVGCIAEKFDISPQVIYENNKWIKDDMIKIGDVLDLTVLQPEVTVQTVEHVTETESIEPITVIQKNSNMRAGESKVVREGKAGKKKVVYQLTKQNGYLMNEELLGEQVLEPSVPAIVMKGTKVILGEGTGRFAWPVSGAKLTSSYGTRWGRLHKGIDLIGNKTILAADSGVVSFAGYKNGLGNAVIINHKNGYETIYGHLSKVTVEKGQVVEQGDKLGIMGNTGHSFGTHLHFEIHKDGKVQNPIKYL